VLDQGAILGEKRLEGGRQALLFTIRIALYHSRFRIAHRVFRRWAGPVIQPAGPIYPSVTQSGYDSTRLDFSLSTIKMPGEISGCSSIRDGPSETAAFVLYLYSTEKEQLHSQAGSVSLRR